MTPEHLHYLRHYTRLVKICSVAILSILIFKTQGFSQTFINGATNCPGYATRSNFSPLCFIKSGEIKLGQGLIANLQGPDAIAASIPTNRKTFGLAIAHAWGYSRNILRIYSTADSEYKPNINWWMATHSKEASCACDWNATFNPVFGSPVGAANYSLKCDEAARIPNTNDNQGCFQVEVGNFLAKQQIFPSRFPSEAMNCNPTYPNAGLYEMLIGNWKNVAPYNTCGDQGEVNFETSALYAAYLHVDIIRRQNYHWGWKAADFYAQARDPYAYEKLFGVHYNLGDYGFGGAATPFFNQAGTQRGYYQNIYNMTQDPGYPLVGWNNYAFGMSKSMAVLDSLISTTGVDYTGYGGVNAGSRFFEYWNPQIAWADVSNYLDAIVEFYPDYNMTTVKAQIKPVFDAINGGGTISFRYQYGAVNDAIIQAFPKEDPLVRQTQVSGFYYGKTCNTGIIVPGSHIDADGPTTFCLGESVNLEAVVEGFGSTTDTYKWYVGSSTTPFSTDRIAYVSPSAVGSYVYRLEVCTGSVCTPAFCDVTITVNNCPSCLITTVGTTQKASCKSVKDGFIQLNLNRTSNFSVQMTGPVNATYTITAGNTITISNIPDGAYDFTITDLNDPACNAKHISYNLGYTVNLNDIVIASNTTSPVVCNANLSAEVKQFPQPCTYRVHVESVSGGWEDGMMANVVTNAGVADMQYTGTGWPAFTDKYFSVENGEILKVGMTVTPGGFPSNLVSYRFDIYDNFNVLVRTVNVAVGAIPASAGMKIVDQVTIDCKFTPNSYTYNWSVLSGSGAITGPTNTLNTTTQGSLTSTVVYQFTATLSSNSACKLTDTARVVYNCPTSLPVDWISFSANKVENTSQLVWTTANEKNTYKYFIERTTDFKNYQTIGELNSVGNTSTHSYYFTDFHPDLNTVNYYRIKQLDQDGKFEYSDLRYVKFDDAIISYVVYPNPSQSSFNVSVNGMNYNEETFIEVYDVFGQTVYQDVFIGNDMKSCGQTWIAGTYIIKFHTDSFSKFLKVVKE